METPPNMATDKAPRNAKKIRILIADDHDVVLRGLRVLIESEYGWEICGQATNGRQAVEMAAQFQPDVAVLDISMPELSGVDATREIKRANAGIEVLILTGGTNESALHQSFAAGALGCLLKSDASEHLIPAIQSLCQHQPYLGPSTSRVVFDRYVHGGGASDQAEQAISTREQEVLKLVAQGLSNKEAASKLSISVKTVETHRSAIMRKMAFKSFSDLVRYAIRNQLIEP